MNEAFVGFLVLYSLAFFFGFALGRVTAPRTYVEVPEEWEPLEPDEPEWAPPVEDL